MDTASDDPILAPSRLRAALATGLLDSPPERAFDDLTRLAAVLVGAPLAFATVVDDARSFWKSCFGLPAGAPRQNTVEESFCQYVVRSRDELIVTDATLDERTRANPSVAAMGVRAWAGFPLLAPDGEVLGSFCVVDTVARTWSERDREVLRTLADAASREIALRGAIQDERRARVRAETLAHTLQESLLPPALPAVPGLDVAACFQPAGRGLELVGDFYDLFQSRDDTWSFVVGDVCGKGIGAAKIAALARHTVGAAAMQRVDSGEVLAWLNDVLLARSPEPDLFLTAVYGTIVLDGGACVVRLACAGHEPPVLRRADGSAAPLAVRGPLVGIMPQFEIGQTELRLQPGESLVLYTDGVTEARNGKRFFGEEALLTLIALADPNADAATLARRIEEAVLDFSGGEANDDIAVLVIRCPPLAVG